MKNKYKFWNWSEHDGERILRIDGIIAEESWIDDDVTPKQFQSELTSGEGNVSLWINSAGGDVVAACQIYNLLKDYKGKVTVKIDGLAASAASMIAMAGDEILMSPVSTMMIHNPVASAYGNTEEMEKVIDMLSEIKESILNAYELKTHLSRTKISHMMDEETWINANKAVELGFADDILFKGEKETEQEINSEPLMFHTRLMNKQILMKLKEANKEVPKETHIRIEPLIKRLELLKRR